MRKPVAWAILAVSGILLSGSGLACCPTTQTDQGASTSEQGRPTDKSFDLLGATVTVKEVSLPSDTTRAQEKGDYLDVILHVDNRAGPKQIDILPSNAPNDEYFIGIAVEGAIAADRRSDVPDPLGERFWSFKVGEQGDIRLSFDLNPGSIDRNPSVQCQGRLENAPIMAV